MIHPSSLVRRFGGWPDWSPTARMQRALPAALQYDQLLCALREHRRPTGLPSSYIFGILSVLLIMRLPDKTNSNAKGWNSHGPIVQVPP